MFLFGDIIIVNFPFSDGRGSKRRPALVIKDTTDGDLLVARITTQPYKTFFDVELNNWAQANLLSPSVVRIHKLQTIYAQLVFDRIGSLTPQDLNAVKATFNTFMQSL